MDETGHAFISYAHLDSESVSRLERFLGAAGVPVWRDTDKLDPGVEWEIVIRKAIQQDALAFLACFSTAGIARPSGYQNKELGWAVEEMQKRKPGGAVWLIPIRFDDCEVPPWPIGAGRTLADLQRIDLFGADQDVSLARLVRAVSKVLGQLESMSPTAVRDSIATADFAERGPLLAASLRDVLLDDSKRIQAEELVQAESRRTLQAVTDDSRFPLGNGDLSEPALADRVWSYWEELRALCYAAGVAGAYGGPRNEVQWRQVIEALAQLGEDPKGGLTVLIDLRKYLVIPVLYAGGVAAVARENYGMLKSFITSPGVESYTYGSTSLIAVRHHWSPFVHTERVPTLVAHRTGDIVWSSQQIAAFLAQRGGKRHTPMPDHLHDVLRPVLQELVLDDRAYEAAFDRFEVLLGALSVDALLVGSDETNSMRSGRTGWFGRFTWRRLDYVDNLQDELKTDREAWQPLRSGLFGGDVTRAEEALRQFGAQARAVASQRH